MVRRILIESGLIAAGFGVLLLAWLIAACAYEFGYRAAAEDIRRLSGNPAILP